MFQVGPRAQLTAASVLCLCALLASLDVGSSTAAFFAGCCVSWLIVPFLCDYPGSGLAYLAAKYVKKGKAPAPNYIKPRATSVAKTCPVQVIKESPVPEKKPEPVLSDMKIVGAGCTRCDEILPEGWAQLTDADFDFTTVVKIPLGKGKEGYVDTTLDELIAPQIRVQPPASVSPVLECEAPILIEENPALCENTDEAVEEEEKPPVPAREREEQPELPAYTGTVRRGVPGSGEKLVDCYTEAPGETFMVRGPNYLSDKVKIPSKPSMCKLLCLDILQSDEKLFDIGKYPKVNSFDKFPDVERFIIINFMFPGTPVVHLVSYFALPTQPTDDSVEARNSFELLKRFVSDEETDDFRIKGLKFIQTIVEGSYMIKKMVGSKPGIIGKKMDTHFPHGPRYFEVDADISSNSMASRIFGSVRSNMPSMVMDLAFTIEGHTPEELPEQILAGLRVHNLNMADHTRIIEPSDLC